MQGRSGKHVGTGLPTLILVGAITLIVSGLCFGQQDYPHFGPLVPPRDSLHYVPNEVVVTLKPAATEADLAALTSKLGGTIKRKSQYMGNVYTIRLPGAGTTAGDTPADRLLPAVLADPAVATAQRNSRYYPTAVPNDPLYPFGRSPLYPDTIWGQWAFQPDPDFPARKHTRVQQAWDIEKGKNDVVVAVIDTGVRVSPKVDGSGKITRIPHPDLTGRLLGGVDFTGKDDPSPSDSEDDAGWSGHGTHVAGIIGASTNNARGVAGLCWNGVWILALKVFPDGGEGATSDDLVADAVMYCIGHRNESRVPGTTLGVDVINMSLGFSLYSEILRSAVAQANRAGIVVVAAAGNYWDYGPWPPCYPGAYEDVICVSATDIDDRITYWSQRGAAVDLAAPGEDILSTIWYRWMVDDQAITGGGGSQPPTQAVVPLQGSIPPYEPFDIYGNGYAKADGTSMASPMVSAAAALLRSRDVPPHDVKEILCETATPIGIGRPNDSYGWGLIDVEAALKKACIDVEIRQPGLGSTVGSTRPRFQIDFRHADASTMRVWIDGQLVAGPASENPAISNWRDYLAILDRDGGKTTLVFDYAVAATADGLHRVRASATTDLSFETPPVPPLSDEDEHPFRVSSRTLSHGWHLFSIPYMFDTPPTPEDYFGDSSLILARWNYAARSTGEYSMYCADKGRTDQEASFNPLSVRSKALAAPHDASTGTPPTGVGYWLYVPAADGYEVPESSGTVYDGQAYDIRLYKGWNMVGNPFPFPVQWANVVVEYAGSQVTMSAALSRGWISPHVFRYDNTYRRYIRYNMVSAVMVPWEAQWVSVRAQGPEGWDEPDVRLIVPAIPYTGTIW